MRQQSCHAIHRMRYPRLYIVIPCKNEDMDSYFLHNLGSHAVEAMCGYVEQVASSQHDPSVQLRLTLDTSKCRPT